MTTTATPADSAGKPSIERRYEPPRVPHTTFPREFKMPDGRPQGNLISRLAASAETYRTPHDPEDARRLGLSKLAYEYRLVDEHALVRLELGGPPPRRRPQQTLTDEQREIQREQTRERVRRLRERRRAETTPETGEETERDGAGSPFLAAKTGCIAQKRPEPPE